MAEITFHNRQRKTADRILKAAYALDRTAVYSHGGLTVHGRLILVMATAEPVEPAETDPYLTVVEKRAGFKNYIQVRTSGFTR